MMMLLFCIFKCQKLLQLCISDTSFHTLQAMPNLPYVHNGLTAGFYMFNLTFSGKYLVNKKGNDAEYY